MNYRLCVGDLSMNYHWIADESPMNYRYIVDGLSMIYRWFVNAFSMNYRWLVVVLVVIILVVVVFVIVVVVSLIFWWHCRFIGTNAYVTCWFAKMSIGVCNLHRDSCRDFCKFCHFCRMHVVVGSSMFRIGFCIDYLGFLSLCMFSLISLVFWSNVVYTIF